MNIKVDLKSLAPDILALYQSKVLELQLKEDLLNSKILVLTPHRVTDGGVIDHVNTYSLITMIFNNDYTKGFIVTAIIPLEEYLTDLSPSSSTRDEAVSLWTSGRHWFTVLSGANVTKYLSTFKKGKKK